MASILQAISEGNIDGLRKHKIMLTMLQDYVSSPKTKTPPLEIFRIHRKGFTVADWKLLGITDQNYKGYVSSKQYRSMHPLNKSYSRWIDDKLTLWYLCQGTSLAKNMPEYYYQIDEGKVMALNCQSGRDASSRLGVSPIADLLQEKKVLAFKRVRGSTGQGFFKVEYRDGGYFVNGQKMSRSEWCDFAKSLNGYIVCEYLKPHAQLAAVFPDTPNTFRYLACRIDGELTFLKSFIRFGTSSTGFVENFNQGGILCYIDASGHYDSGYMIDRSRGLAAQRMSVHPDTGKTLVGDIPLWSEVQRAASKFGELFPQLDYVGFDFVVTNDERAIILEINSLTSLDTIQLDCSLLDTPTGKVFFGSRLKK